MRPECVRDAVFSSFGMDMWIIGVGCGCSLGRSFAGEICVGEYSAGRGSGGHERKGGISGPRESWAYGLVIVCECVMMLWML